MGNDLLLGSSVPVLVLESSLIPLWTPAQEHRECLHSTPVRYHQVRRGEWRMVRKEIGCFRQVIEKGYEPWDEPSGGSGKTWDSLASYELS